MIWAENQLSLGASEKVLWKERFEKWLWEKACVETYHMHGDNGIFASDHFRFTVTTSIKRIFSLQLEHSIRTQD